MQTIRTIGINKGGILGPFNGKMHPNLNNKQDMSMQTSGLRETSQK